MKTNSLLGNFEEIEASINPKKEIKQFIGDNYITSRPLKISRMPNENGKYIVKCNHVRVNWRNHLTSLTNNLFEWGIVNHFDCSFCTSLTSLEGAPKEVGGDFYCSGCSSLKTLEGSPKEVGGDFNCSRCTALTSLEGAPKKVGRDFYCSGCSSLKTLEGSPKEVGGDFNCSRCTALTSLEGAPKKVSRYFYCLNCGGHFTVEDVKKVCDVGMEISANDTERCFCKKL